MRYIASKDYVLRTIAGEKVLVSVRSGVADFSGIITMNDTAAWIWTCLQKGTTEEDLLQSITRKFDVSRETAGEDIAEVLRMLQARKMIHYA